jgi:hypothetical protein
MKKAYCILYIVYIPTHHGCLHSSNKLFQQSENCSFADVTEKAVLAIHGTGWAVLLAISIVTAIWMSIYGRRGCKGILLYNK